MRILFLSDYFLPLIGGVQVRAVPFIQEMRKRGHEFVVVTSHEHPEHVPSESDYGGVRVLRFPMVAALRSGDPRQIVAVRRRIAALRRSFAPDLVHAFIAGPAVLFLLETARDHPAPLLASLTIYLTHREAGPDTAAGKALRSAAWVTANAEAILRRLRALVPDIAARSSVIYSGEPLPDIAPTPLPVDEPVLLCLGRVAAEKGLDLAIRACATVRREFPRARLLIAGDGAVRGELEQLARECNVADAVDFLGLVAPARVAALINRATMLLVPSRWEEAFASVAIQAAQMARPVVATAVGGMSEAVRHGETGLLVAPEDPVALAEAVGLLLRQPAWASELGHRARDRAVRDFAWVRYVDEFEELYRRLANHSTPPAIEGAPSNRLDPRTVPRSLLLRKSPVPSIDVSFVVIGEGTADGRDRGIEAAGNNGRGLRHEMIVVGRSAAALRPRHPGDPAPPNAGSSAVPPEDATNLLRVTNLGAKQARGDIIVFLAAHEADLAVAVEPLVRLFRDNPDVAMVNGPTLAGLLQDGRRPGEASQAAFPLAVRGEVWMAVGGFEESYAGRAWAIADLERKLDALGCVVLANGPARQPGPGSGQVVSPPPGGATDAGEASDARMFRQRWGSFARPVRAPGSPASASSRREHMVVYTAITRTYDTLKHQSPVATEGVELVAFLDGPTERATGGKTRGWQVKPLAGPEDDPVRLAKICKVLPHRLFADKAYSLWIDASVSIVFPFPLERLIDLYLGDADLCVFQHAQRSCIYDEAEVCISQQLDSRSVIEAQMRRYREEGYPRKFGLVEATVLLRRHSPAIRAFDEAWWQEIHQGSRRDQLSFNYVARKLGLAYRSFPLSLGTHNGLFVKYLRSINGADVAGDHEAPPAQGRA